MALMAQAYSKFEKPKFSNQGPPFLYDSLISERLLLSNSRKLFFLKFDDLKSRRYSLTMLSHSSFLLKSYDILLE